MYLVVYLITHTYQLLIIVTTATKLTVKCEIYDDEEITIYNSGYNLIFVALIVSVAIIKEIYDIVRILHSMGKLKLKFLDLFLDSISTDLMISVFYLIFFIEIFRFVILPLRRNKIYILSVCIVGDKKNLGLSYNSEIVVDIANYNYIGKIYHLNRIYLTTSYKYTLIYNPKQYDPIFYKNLSLNEEIEMKIGSKTVNYILPSHVPNNRYFRFSTLDVTIHVKDLSILQPVNETEELEVC